MTDERLAEFERFAEFYAYHLERFAVASFLRSVPELIAEVRRLKDRLNHQTEDDVEACRQGKHEDCGRVVQS